MRTSGSSRQHRTISSWSSFPFGSKAVIHPDLPSACFCPKRAFAAGPVQGSAGGGRGRWWHAWPLTACIRKCSARAGSGVPFRFLAWGQVREVSVATRDALPCSLGDRIAGLCHLRFRLFCLPEIFVPSFVMDHPGPPSECIPSVPGELVDVVRLRPPQKSRKATSLASQSASFESRRLCGTRQ